LDRLVNLYSFSFSPPEEKLEYLKETEENIIPLVSIYNEKLVEEMQKVMEYLKDIYVLPPDISLKLEELRKRNL
jgi:hypothetical protein